MNISTDEIQRFGFQKIWKVVVEDNKKEFFEELNRVNSLTSACKLSPYSAYRHLDLIKQLTYEEAGGIIGAMQYAFTEGSQESVRQRKFRDNWEKMWTKFGEACNLDTFDTDILKVVSVRVPLLIIAVESCDTEAMKIMKFSRSFYTALGVDEDKVRERGYLYNNVKCIRTLCKFINMVSSWFKTSSSESNSEKAIRYLIFNDFEEFEKDLSSGKRLWLDDEAVEVNSEGTTALKEMSSVYKKSGEDS